MVTRMQIVRFNNGKYGIRRGYGWWGYDYLDLADKQYWRSRTDVWFKDCTTADLDRIKEVYAAVTSNDIGKPI